MANGKKVRWGILSTANIGLKKVTPAIMKSPLSEVVAVASRDLGRAEAYIAELGLTGKATAHGSYEALLADPNVDAIYNPLPNHLHVPMTLAAARKHGTEKTRCRKNIVVTSVKRQGRHDVLYLTPPKGGVRRGQTGPPSTSHFRTISRPSSCHVPPSGSFGKTRPSASASASAKVAGQRPAAWTRSSN